MYHLFYKNARKQYYELICEIFRIQTNFRFYFIFGDNLFLIGGYGGYGCGYFSDADIIGTRIDYKVCQPIEITHSVYYHFSVAISHVVKHMEFMAETVILVVLLFKRRKENMTFPFMIR